MKRIFAIFSFLFLVAFAFNTENVKASGTWVGNDHSNYFWVWHVDVGTMNGYYDLHRWVDYNSSGNLLYHQVDIWFQPSSNNYPATIFFGFSNIYENTQTGNRLGTIDYNEWSQSSSGKKYTTLSARSRLNFGHNSTFVITGSNPTRIITGVTTFATTNSSTSSGHNTDYTAIMNNN